MAEPLECVFHRSFLKSNAEATYLSGLEFERETRFRLPRYDGKRDGATKRRRSLTHAEEREIFLRFNYFRHRVMQILIEWEGRRLSAAAARELLKWDKLAEALRDQIVDANLGLVPTMVERSRITGVDFGELISEGQLALLRSIDKFDCGRGFKFSTYACRAIITAITRAVALMARHRSRFPTEFDPDLQKGDYIEMRRAGVEEDSLEELQDLLHRNAAELTKTERRVLSERFGIRSTAGRRQARDQKTLRQVAEIFGVTKERVRQIQNRALSKLRSVLDQRMMQTK